MLRYATCLACVLCALALTHCADPTEGKPQAEVGDAIVTDEEPTAAEEMAAESGETPEDADPFSQSQEGSRPKDEKADKLEGTVYKLVGNAGIQFEGSKVTGTHVGGFSEYDGTVIVPEGDLEQAKIDVTVQMDSVFSDAGGLTEKLKGEEFFHVEKYPTATFKSTSIEETGSEYKVTGNFNLHGVTKSISFPAEINLTDEKLTAYAEFVIKQFDWGIKYRGIGEDLIRDEVLILLDVEGRPETGGAQ